MYVHAQSDYILADFQLYTIINFMYSSFSSIYNITTFWRLSIS